MIDTYFSKTLPDGRQVDVVPLTFGRARITVGDGYLVNDGW
jgi:hypothetical protein